ncbi:unnamed protein product [Vitrella brassicaformis CCMP3155]|uniref:RING-type domain-containing protein n=1 Tax=Vitrella brassicaformis (strain CCMP3155) TaxID=1169540 RepID=A0A0G4H5V9_VITBC|nr:unnamed protein product [Vitrella brassicaformis CCMP3155]|eukprot:CEM39233.1 unnamed protein product [Vitrella brassicaformis CCMP3155]
MSTEANSEELSAGSPTEDSNSPDNRGDASQQEQPQQQQHECMSGNPAEEGSGGSGRSGDESYGSGPGDRTESASSAPPPASPHRERKPATDSNKATSRQLASAPPIAIQRPPMPTGAIDTHQSQQQPQPSVPRGQSMQLTPIASQAVDASAVGGVPMQQQEGGSRLTGEAKDGDGSVEDDSLADATADGSRQPPTASDVCICTQQQHAVDPTSSMIDPSPLAAAAASADRQPASPSCPSPPSTNSPISPDQQHTANARQGQASGSDAAAITCAAVDALLAGDIAPFVEQVKKLREMPLLPYRDPAVGRLVLSLAAKKDEAHRQQGQGGLAGCIVGLVRDSSDASIQAAVGCFLAWLDQAGYPFGAEWLPLFGVLVESTAGRLRLPSQVFMAARGVMCSDTVQVTAEDLGAFRKHMFCHIDGLVETLVTSSDQVIVWRAYELIGIIFSCAFRCTSDPGVLAPMCRTVSASPAALGKIATMLKDHAACEWLVLFYLNVPLAMAESGYCERLVQAGFLSATLSVIHTHRYTPASMTPLLIRALGPSIRLLGLILARNSYASCEGLAELMCSHLLSVVTQDTECLASVSRGGTTISSVLHILGSLASYWDRELISGKAKDNPIVESVLQVDISALSVPPIAASHDSLTQDIAEIMYFFDNFRRRKVAIDRWVSSLQDPQREAARQQNKQNPMVRCLSDKRVLHTVYRLVGPLKFRPARVAVLAVSCRSLLDALCPVRSTDRISSYANRELLAPEAWIKVSNHCRLAAALARYSTGMMLTLSIRWECSLTADDISDLIGFLEEADHLIALSLTDVDLREVPDDECTRLANAIGHLPSLAVLYLVRGHLIPAFADRLSALLKAKPEGDGKDDGSSSSSSSISSPPPSSSRDVTHMPSTSSAAVPADSEGDGQATTEEGQTANAGDDTKERSFAELGRMTILSCHVSFKCCVNLLEGLCGKSFEYLELSDAVLTTSGNEANQHDQLQTVLERLFGTIACEEIQLSFASVGELSLRTVEDTVRSAATAGLRTNPNRRTLRNLGLAASAIRTASFLHFVLKDLTLSRLSLISSVPLGQLVSQQFLSSDNFESLVHGAVTRADEKRETEEDRRMAARERREERLRAEEKEIRSNPSFVLDLTNVPFTSVSASDRFLIGVIEEINKKEEVKYAYKEPVIVTDLSSVSEELYVEPSSNLPKHLCEVLVRSYNTRRPLTWLQTVIHKAPTLLTLYINSVSCDSRRPVLASRFQDPCSVTAADLAMYGECVGQLEALKDDPAVNYISQKDVDEARTALNEAISLGQEQETVHLAALCEKQKRVAVIDSLLATLQTKLSDLEGQRDKAALSKAEEGDIDSIDAKIARRFVAGKEPPVDGQPKSRCELVREQLRERLEVKQKQKALQERRMKRQADKKTDDVSDDSDDQQQQGEGGKKAKKKRRPKNKGPRAAPSTAAPPCPLADGSAPVREGGEADGGFKLVDSEPSSSLLHVPAVAAGAAAAAMSAASGSLVPQALTTAPMPPLPGGGREFGAVGDRRWGGDERLAGQVDVETDGGAAGHRDDGRVSVGGETEAMRARFAAELMRRDQQIKALRHESLAARREIEHLREAQAAGEQTVADTLAANERLQADMKKANEVHRQQLGQQHQRLTSAAAEREASLRQENASLREETASLGEANRALQADIYQLRSNQIDQLTETFNGLTTADELSGFAMQLADRQTAIMSTELPQLQSLERRAQQAAQQKREAELRQQMQQSNQRAREEAIECQVCQETERSVVLQPCGHFCICQQCAQNLQPPECPLCRQVFTSWTNAIFS